MEDAGLDGVFGRDGSSQGLGLAFRLGDTLGLDRVEYLIRG